MFGLGGTGIVTLGGGVVWTYGLHGLGFGISGVASVAPDARLVTNLCVLFFCEIFQAVM